MTIVITCILLRACYAQGMTSHPHAQGNRIVGYAKAFAVPMRNKIRENTLIIAKDTGWQLSMSTTRTRTFANKTWWRKSTLCEPQVYYLWSTSC
ncbi:MAG: hypothetical protein WAW61_08670 [Methylococcaceae bacterium]